MLKTACAVYNKTTTTARQKARNARKARFHSFFQEKKRAICAKKCPEKRTVRANVKRAQEVATRQKDRTRDAEDRRKKTKSASITRLYQPGALRARKTLSAKGFPARPRPLDTIRNNSNNLRPAQSVKNCFARQEERHPEQKTNDKNQHKIL